MTSHFVTHESGRRLHLGRRPMVAPKMTMRFGDYQKLSFPPAPATFDYWTAKADAALRNVYLNDEHGDCVIAWMAHATALFMANAGLEPQVFTDAQIVEMYSAIGGFNPNDPANTDNGCDENTALDYWLAKGFVLPTHKIEGALAVDAANDAEVASANWSLENLMYGVPMPDEWVAGMSTLKDGDVWDVAGPPNESNGHCFGSTGRLPNGNYQIDSWGFKLEITPAANAKYAVPSAGGQLFSVVTKESLNRASEKADNGLDWAAIVADFNGMGGRLGRA